MDRTSSESETVGRIGPSSESETVDMNRWSSESVTVDSPASQRPWAVQRVRDRGHEQAPPQGYLQCWNAVGGKRWGRPRFREGAGGLAFFRVVSPAAGPSLNPGAAAPPQRPVKNEEELSLR